MGHRNLKNSTPGMHHITLFWDEKIINILWRGTAPPQTPPPRLDSRVFGARPATPSMFQWRWRPREYRHRPVRCACPWRASRRWRSHSWPSPASRRRTAARRRSASTGRTLSEPHRSALVQRRHQSVLRCGFTYFCPLRKEMTFKNENRKQMDRKSLGRRQL